MTRPAVFLDRDGTIVREVHFMSSPEQVELLPGVASAIAKLNSAGVPAVVITNQSGIARGLFTHADYERVRERLNELLARENARLDGSWMCPHHPDFTGPCECRKPGTLLFRQAAEALNLDLSRSWYVGDHMRDVQPAAALGGHGVLVPSDDTRPEELPEARAGFAVSATLDEVVRQVLESAR